MAKKTPISKAKKQANPAFMVPASTDVDMINPPRRERVAPKSLAPRPSKGPKPRTSKKEALPTREDRERKPPEPRPDDPVVVSDNPLFRLTPAQDKGLNVLISDATHVALGGGSRSGKTFLFVRAVIIRALKSNKSRHAIFRFTFSSIKASIIYDTLPKVMELCFPGLEEYCNLNKTDWFLRLPNGSELWFAGLDDKDRTEKILGQEFVTVYFNECSQIPWHSVQLALTRLAQKAVGLRLKAYYDFNPPSKKHWTYLRFVDKKDPITRLPVEKPENFGFYLINPADNQENLSDEYLEILRALPEKARNRFLYGKFADDDEGSLWTEELLELNRRAGGSGVVPEFLRVVIAVDPSGCKGSEDTRSDEVGIIVAALGTDSHAYILEDLSGKYSPEEWGNIACEAFTRHHADVIVGEVNYGGDMVRAIIQAQNANVPYKEVRASRGKVVRAEPISHLYEQHKVHHVGRFHDLEDQLLGMTQSGYMGIKSPDRADAAIWAIFELFPSITRKVDDRTLNCKVIAPQRSASRFGRNANSFNRTRY